MSVNKAVEAMLAKKGQAKDPLHQMVGELLDQWGRRVLVPVSNVKLIREGKPPLSFVGGFAQTTDDARVLEVQAVSSTYITLSISYQGQAPILRMCKGVESAKEYLRGVLAAPSK